MGAVTPPYDPETLAILFENSSSLRQNVDSYVTNIDAFGHRFEPVIDLDASDADQHIANALAIERSKAGAPGDAPTPKEVAAKKRVTITCSPNFGYRHFLKVLGSRRLEGLALRRACA